MLVKVQFSLWKHSDAEWSFLKSIPSMLCKLPWKVLYDCLQMELMGVFSRPVYADLNGSDNIVASVSFSQGMKSQLSKKLPREQTSLSLPPVARQSSRQKSSRLWKTMPLCATSAISIARSTSHGWTQTASKKCKSSRRCVSDERVHCISQIVTSHEHSVA